MGVRHAALPRRSARIFACAFLLMCGFAQAAELNFVVGGSAAFPRIQDTGVSTPVTFGMEPDAGLMFSFPISLKLTAQLEMGVLYVGRRYTATPVTATEYQWRCLEFPVDFRLPVTKGFELLLGGYVAYGMSLTTYVASGPGTLVTPETFASQGLSPLDYGFLVGLGYKIEIGRRLWLAVDMRYLYGAASFEVSTVKSGYHQNVEVLTGLKLSL